MFLHLSFWMYDYMDKYMDNLWKIYSWGICNIPPFHKLGIWHRCDRSAPLPTCTAKDHRATIAPQIATVFPQIFGLGRCSNIFFQLRKWETKSLKWPRFDSLVGHVARYVYSLRMKIRMHISDISWQSTKMVGVEKSRFAVNMAVGRRLRLAACVLIVLPRSFSGRKHARR